MDFTDLTQGFGMCQECSALRIELEHLSKEYQQFQSQQIAGLTTMKQKIFATDKIIREFQVKKLEHEAQTRKVEEFARLVDQLHRDLARCEADYSKALGELQPMQKLCTERAEQIKMLQESAEEWKNKADAANVLNEQLTLKLNQLDLDMAALGDPETVLKEQNKLKQKLDTTQKQLKEARDQAAQRRKEYVTVQRKHRSALRQALRWGDIADSKGLLSNRDKKILETLKNGNDEADIADSSDAGEEDNANDVKAGSRLLEQLLDQEKEAGEVDSPPSDQSEREEIEKIPKNENENVFLAAEQPIPPPVATDFESLYQNSRKFIEAGTQTSEAGESKKVVNTGTQTLETGQTNKVVNTGTQTLVNGELKKVVEKETQTLETGEPKKVEHLESPAVDSNSESDELEEILLSMKTTFPAPDRLISPLPSSPKRSLHSATPKKIADTPKPVSRPRCSFDWTGKHLKVKEKATQFFGPRPRPSRGIKVCYRRLGVLRYQPVVSELLGKLKTVANFAEAERKKPQPAPAAREKKKFNNHDLFGDSSSESDTEVPAATQKSLVILPSKHRVVPATLPTQVPVKQRAVPATVVPALRCQERVSSAPSENVKQILEPIAAGDLDIHALSAKKRLARQPRSVPAKPEDFVAKSSVAQPEKQQRIPKRSMEDRLSPSAPEAKREKLSEAITNTPEVVVRETVANEPLQDRPASPVDPGLEKLVPESSSSAVGDPGEAVVTNETTVESLDDESPQSPPPEGFLEILPAVIPLEEPGTETAYEMLEKILEHKSESDGETKKRPQGNQKKAKKHLNNAVNQFLKAVECSSDAIATTADHVSKGNLNVFMRHLMSVIAKDCNSELDTTFTPPAPALTPLQQRCLLLLQAVEDKIEEKTLIEDFLRCLSSSMFQENATYTIEEACALARVYTAICRLKGRMDQARCFLYDCVYFQPPRAYALVYTMLSGWAEILQHSSSIIGVSALEQTLVYLLTVSNKVKAIPGVKGKVLQVRSLLRAAHGYEASASGSLENLLLFVTQKMKDVQSLDEAHSLAAALDLLAQWEGTDWACDTVIKQHLWPLFQQWSSGHGEDAVAVGVVTSIARIGKRLPLEKQSIVAGITGVLKNVMEQYENVSHSVQEAVIEALRLLCAETQPELILDLLRHWKPRQISQPLRKILLNFLRSCCSK